MSPSVGFPPRHARIPSAWTEALPGLGAVDDAEEATLLARLGRGELDAVVVEAVALAPGGRLAGADLMVGATPQRIEPRDLLVPAEGASTLDALPQGGRVALTGSRRRALLAVHRPELVAVELPDHPERTVGPFLRGGGAEAAVVSARVAREAGLSDDASEVLPPKAWMPAPGQGASILAVRAGDQGTVEALRPLDHPPTHAALEAEGAVARALGLEPDATLGVLALPYGRWLRLWAMLPAPDGRRLVRGDLSGSQRRPAELGERMARLLLDRGAALIPGVAGAATREVGA